MLLLTTLAFARSEFLDVVLFTPMSMLVEPTLVLLLAVHRASPDLLTWLVTGEVFIPVISKGKFIIDAVRGVQGRFVRL